MTDISELKATHSDLTRRLEADVLEEQRIRAELQEKLNKHQQAANSDSQMAEALLRPILKRREVDNRRKTEVEGILKYLESLEKAKSELAAAKVAAGENNDAVP